MRTLPVDALNLWRRLLLVTAGVVVIAGPVVVGMVYAARLGAQSPSAGAGGPAFEVASVKRNRSGDEGFTMQPQPGGRITVVNAPLRLLIRNAYRVQDFQIVGGPSWLNSDRFDIVAKAEGSPSQDQLQLMLRALLADRFKLRVHNETRELPIYALVIARSDGKTGRQFRRAGPCFRAPGNAPPQSPPLLGPAPCGFRVGPGTMAARGVTIAALAASLSSRVSRVVLDRTGLTGDFDLELQFTPESRPAASSNDPGGIERPADSGPSIFTALEEQLGLKLESQRGPVDVLVIDSVEPPTEN